jgi:hypothetical protein
MLTEKEMRMKYRSILPHLDERQRRLIAASDVLQLGRGGVSMVARTSGLTRPTLYRGIEELGEGIALDGRTRCAGGGRKRLLESQPVIESRLRRLVEPTTRGDPMSPLRWTCKSTRQLAEELKREGFSMSHPVVGTTLRAMGYSLQANEKTIEGSDHPDRNAQFEHINALVKKYLRQGWPVISVDTKKKELVGTFKNAGRTWRRQGRPEQVRVHDFIDPKVGKAIPYGVYDIGRDDGWVNVGCDADTSEFAVESIRRWWRSMGRRNYFGAKNLLITADSGGSNGYRVRLWKAELQRLADEMGTDITVCHFPPGTSKWNKIEHRLFSHISMNWRGKPLISHEVVVNLIGATTTRTGLNVRAKLDTNTYETNRKVGDDQMAQVKLIPHKFHGEWNYTISCRKS